MFGHRDEGDVYWEPVPDLAGRDDLAEALRACPVAAEHFDEASFVTGVAMLVDGGQAAFP